MLVNAGADLFFPVVPAFGLVFLHGAVALSLQCTKRTAPSL
jgi:hypothetical protein